MQMSYKRIPAVCGDLGPSDLGLFCGDLGLFGGDTFCYICIYLFHMHTVVGERA